MSYRIKDLLSIMDGKANFFEVTVTVCWLGLTDYMFHDRSMQLAPSGVGK